MRRACSTGTSRPTPKHSPNALHGSSPGACPRAENRTATNPSADRPMELFGTDLGLSAIIAGVILLAAPVPLWLLYQTIGHLFRLTPQKPRLSAVMAAVFVYLSIPILIFILAYNYYRISEAMMATLADDVAKAREGSIESVEKMVEGMA